MDPKTVLGDSDIIVLDSNDLPEGWKERIEENQCPTRHWESLSETMREFEEFQTNATEIIDENIDNIVDDSGEIDENVDKALPKRILIFSSKKLLKLF